MQTTIDEVNEGIYQIFTFVADANLSFNQILVTGEQPFLFHTGMRALFPLVSEAVARAIPIEDLRWISFGHVEAYECGSMNQWLAASPGAHVALGSLRCMVSVNDLADRPPTPLADGETLDIGGKRLRYFATPHVPHGWDAGVFYEESTGTLLCGDLFTQMGDGPVASSTSPLEAAMAAEDAFGYTCLAPTTVATIERLGELEPTTLALMHGPTHHGPAGDWLRNLAASYVQRSASPGPTSAKRT